MDRSILIVRGQKVLLDAQLASFYGVETKRLVEAVKRNSDRFPDDFMFQLSEDEWASLRSQIATSNITARGGRRYLPYAFTEQGVAMLSGVLRSPRAIAVNVQIMRAFVRLRQLLAVHKELADHLTQLERRMKGRDEVVDQQFRKAFDLLDKLFNPPPEPESKRKPIGFYGEQGSNKVAPAKAVR